LQKHQIIILIPCLNEEKTIIKICKKAKDFGTVLVVDDNSKDKTKFLLKKEQINFFSNQKNLGYEKSLIKGFNFIFKNFKKAKYILTVDADGELPVRNIPEILKEIKKKNFDLIIGNRSKLNRLSENLLDYVFRIKFGLKDPVSGFKLYKIESLRKIISQISYKMFLVDVPIIFYKLNFLMSNMSILTKKRVDKPRIGNSLRSNLKILNIVYKIL
jgi:glycosyltransferase involved in cell wall biosynthesis